MNRLLNLPTVILTLITITALTPEKAHAKKDRAAAESSPPSVQLDPLLEPCLNAIAEPLNKNPKLPRVEVEKLRSDFAAGQVKADTPHQRQIYENAMAVCDALIQGMDERAADVATAQASAKVPNSSTGGSIVKSSPIRGHDAGANAETIRKKQRDERKYADKEAKENAAFVESGAYKVWVEKATGIRKNVMVLYTTQRQLEAYVKKEEEATAAHQKPGADSEKKTFSYAGTWKSSGGNRYIIRDDHTVTRIPKNGANVNGTWKMQKNGFFHIDCEDKTHFDGKLSDDGSAVDFTIGVRWSRQ
jgi:hypothetical protein